MNGAAWRTAVVATDAARCRALTTLLGDTCAVGLETDDLQQASRGAWDLIVMDAAWFEPTKTLEPLHGCAVLLLNATPAHLERLRRAAPRAWGALEVGAEGGSLRAAVNAVARGLITLEPNLLSNTAPPPEDAPEVLTPRELEVLALVFEGLPNKRVAVELGIAVSTVKYHLEGVYAKLGVRSKAQAVRRALELHLVSV